VVLTRVRPRLALTAAGVGCLVAALVACDSSADRLAPWPPAQARGWYDAQPWIVGANFVPSTASNQLEMWQAATFDPDTIDRELGWAAEMGLNTMRVFLHDMLWADDPDGFFDRVDTYLGIAGRHGIRTMFVLFDAVWDPFPQLGPQAEPLPGTHNSRWVQGPHIDVLRDPARRAALEPYVLDVVGRYRDDPRVLAWDVYNEPGNRVLAYVAHEPEDKRDLSAELLRDAFGWARSAAPTQPLTAAVWERVTGDVSRLEPIDHIMLDNSDIITFHSYAIVWDLQAPVGWLQSYDRPVVCTEYLARTLGSTFQQVLPYFFDERIGAIHWGLVSGRTQTIYPWTSWAFPAEEEPEVWFHDVLHSDGSPFDPAEVALFEELTQP
jgi:hypothetical protein